MWSHTMGLGLGIGSWLCLHLQSCPLPWAHSCPGSALPPPLLPLLPTYLLGRVVGKELELARRPRPSQWLWQQHIESGDVEEALFWSIFAISSCGFNRNSWAMKKFKAALWLLLYTHSNMLVAYLIWVAPPVTAAWVLMKKFSGLKHCAYISSHFTTITFLCHWF